ncbi:hypothetical protein FHS29_003032 [Saccharothrix tamanrassetensis]|uniref:Uncharacterized protein n=1 Tax=Saccharothrix tamanrassetensis TaxID=1051531 RepID=A0A841CLJ3_9PSEU|nr:hypothetical protein [Saccharothrix tamanrassetensis]
MTELTGRTTPTPLKPPTPPKVLKLRCEPTSRAEAAPLTGAIPPTAVVATTWVAALRAPQPTMACHGGIARGVRAGGLGGAERGSPLPGDAADLDIARNRCDGGLPVRFGIHGAVGLGDRGGVGPGIGGTGLGGTGVGGSGIEGTGVGSSGGVAGARRVEPWCGWTAGSGASCGRPASGEASCKRPPSGEASCGRAASGGTSYGRSPRCGACPGRGVGARGGSGWCAWLSGEAGLSVVGGCDG